MGSRDLVTVVRGAAGTDENGAVVKKEYRTASGMVVKQISETEFRWPGASKFRRRTIRPSR
jgi:hypothetical protein